MERETLYHRETSRGWGVAALVVGLAVACAVGAAWIHASTYMHPTHPLNPSGGAKAEAVAAPH